MIPTLALRSLGRHRARTLLAVAGVAVASAMLLDMVMLATGMRESFRSLLLTQGFQLRLAPRGTLPFDTEATIGGASSAVARLRDFPGVEAVSPVLGAQLHLVRDDTSITAFVLGLEPAVQGDYELLRGADAHAPNAVVMSEDLLRALGASVGDTVDAATGYDPQLRLRAGQRALVVAGAVRFRYLSAGQQAAAMPIATLRDMAGGERTDAASLLMVRARTGVDVDSLGAAIERMLPSVTAISTERAIQQVDERLSYFRQLAYILGSVSLVVGFLLVTTLVTVSVNERLGEFAVMRAIGVARRRIVAQVVLESAAIMLAGASMGLLLGLVTARYLNSILASFPGLPEAIDFFLFQPGAAWGALGMLAVAGVLAGIYPSWRAASLPIAGTLREEAVG